MFWKDFACFLKCCFGPFKECAVNANGMTKFHSLNVRVISRRRHWGERLGRLEGEKKGMRENEDLQVFLLFSTVRKMQFKNDDFQAKTEEQWILCVLFTNHELFSFYTVCHYLFMQTHPFMWFRNMATSSQNFEVFACCIRHSLILT